MAHVVIALLCLLTLGGSVAQFAPAYSVTYEAYYNSIKSLLEPSTTPTRTKLIQGLYDVGKATTLTPDQNATYYQFVDDLETSVVNVNQTNNQTTKIYLIGKQIGFFNVTQPEVFALVNQQNITGWSTLSNFVTITNMINIPQMLSMIAPITGNTVGMSLFDQKVYAQLAISFLPTEMLAFKKFWNAECAVIVNDTSISQKARFAKVYAKFLDVFFVEHPDWYTLFYSLDMNFWGSFYQMFQTGLTFYQDEHVSELVLGDVATCPLLVQYYAAIYNKTVLLPNVVRAQFKMLYNAIVEEFETTTTLEGRLTIIDTWFGKFVGLQWNYFRWLQYISLGNFGNFQQLVIYIGTRSIYGGTITENVPV